MAIISASRKTDIPACYSDWFLNRLEKKDFCLRNNPYKPEAVSWVHFYQKEDIDCIVFWTKNPIPMMSKLNRLDGYKYYFQFTLTGYGRHIEAGLPDKDELIDAFRELSLKTGGNVVWRYDPIIIDDTHTFNWHIETFTKIAGRLNGFTDRCVISFIDLYSFVEKNLKNAGISTFDVNDVQKNFTGQFLDFCKRISDISQLNGMTVYTCAEKITLANAGIEHGSCIDKNLIEKIVGYKIKAGKDKGQRSACLCAESIDIGAYDTCRNGCRYCYACKNPDAFKKRVRMYSSTSPILCDCLRDTDVVIEKVLRSLKVDEDAQLTLF